MEEQITPVGETQPQEFPAQSPQKRNLAKIVLFIVLGLVVVTGAVYAGIQIERKRVKLWTEPPLTEPSLTEPLPTEIESQSPETTPVAPDETANWEEYKNNRYKFSFKYPKALILEDVSTESILQLKLVAQAFRETTISAMETEEQLYYLDTPPSGEVKVGVLSGKKYLLPNGYCDGPSCSPPNLAAVVYKNGFRYVFSVFVEKDSNNFTDLENQILFTFKFTDSSFITVAPTKTTEKNGARLEEIKYTLPQGWKAKTDNNRLYLSPIDEGGFLAIQVVNYPGNIGRREYYCQITKYCLDRTYFTEMNIGNIAGYKASGLDNSGGGEDYFGTKGDKFYIIGSFSPSSPSPNEFDKNYQEVLRSLIF